MRATTPACPTTNPGEVSGTLEAGDVIGPAAQGITVGRVDEVGDRVPVVAGLAGPSTRAATAT